MTVYFVSDLHLKPERPDLTRAFLHFLQQTAQDAEALYLLGDIFEAWIGDDTPTPDLEAVFSALRQLSAKGCSLYFQHGNRDFLVGQTFADSIGATLLSEALVCDLPCGPALIMHGDQLCTDDQEYMQFRSMVRNPAWQQAFLDKPLQERLAIARQLRDTSKERNAAKDDYITDVNPQAVEQALENAGTRLLIHGHTHRPAEHQLNLADGSTATRVVLGDWDKLGWYLRVEPDGYQLVSFEIEKAA
ncbi:UDP-2,3-diacylglucosamine diphosphatase [Neptuniibacter halophilus]|uniref:UDP-2,3-diacylglucosamine diphosphatase n=1 Tax=Neptuniibacter halophilus TaxID=651666 RepID=UPI00257237BA|nr:UDP-2,3-diacylglucosamine diphosphatase [Neptuniibacter halophilus]